MNLKEIISRPFSEPKNQDEILFVIGEYIERKKGVRVKPKIDTSFGRIGTMMELGLMEKASLIAIAWFKENKHRI